MPAHAQAAAQAQTPGVIASRTLPALLPAAERDRLAQTFAALEAGRRTNGSRSAVESSDPLVRKIFEWLWLQQRRSGATFDDIVGFLEANPEWPNRDVLMRRAEEASVDRLDDGTILAWYDRRKPTTADGAARFADALLRSGARARASAVVSEAWARAGFGKAQEKEFLAHFGGLLGSQDHAARLDNLLWEGRFDEARRIFSRVAPERRALAEARIQLALQGRGVDGALRRVPASLTNDPGLLYERLRWRRRKDMDSLALDILRHPPGDLVRPELWWTERAIMARRLLQDGRGREAYGVVHDHRLAPGPSYAEAEFLAGWIALRHLGDPKLALTHFANLYGAARFPVTLARGALWAGQAAGAIGEEAAAREWYLRAAAYPITFYGQVARAKLSPADRPAWPERPAVSEEERTAFLASELARAARILEEIGGAERVKPFVLRLVASATSPLDHALAAEFAIKLGRPDLAVASAKRSAQNAGIMLPHFGWPIVALADGEPPEPHLVLATIRQESAFEPAAVSRAGARGMMQLMPATARAVAREIGLGASYRDARLLADPGLNIRLGRAYLGRLIDDFGGSYVLALAAYNAGPARARAWVRDYGDPRDPAVDPLDWIESVPFEETRNYIQRVMENLQVYRYLLATTSAERTIAQDLR